MLKVPILLALLLAGQSQDRTRVNAELSQPTVQVGETVILAITVETPTSGDIEIRLPQLPATIPVIGSQESSQLHYAIPGGRRRTVTRELVLQPTSEGVFSLPPIAIDVGGTIYRTQSLTLRVSASAAPSPTMAGTEAWLRVTMSPETVYVGQQTTMTAEAGFSEEVRLRLTRPPIFDTPAPTGFWVQEIPGGIRSSLRTVDGRVVEVQSKKFAYFPLTPGRFALKASRVVLDVRQGFLYAPVTREVRSTSPRVTVLPLPDAGKPVGFRGAVGSYDLQASVEPLTVAAGEPVQIRVLLTGRGNIKALGAPSLPQLVGAEVFAPTEESTTEVQGETVMGTKTFTYVVIPENEGVLNIPSINFSFFDPGARSYRTIKADPVQVRVLPAGTLADTSVSAGSLRALRAKPASATLRWVRTPAFAIAQLIPLLLIAGVIVARRRRPRSDPLAAYLARLAAISQLSDAEVYRALDALLRDAARDATAATHTRARCETVLQRIEVARFAPTPPPAEERAAIQTDVEEVIRAMFARTKTYAAILVFAVLAASPQPFADGSRAYEAGDFQSAALAFEQHTRTSPLDAAGWYNLGNAQFRAGDRGRAFWAWANALRLEPRNTDISRNLQAAGNVEALRVRPPLAVRPEEWLLVAGALWWIVAAFVILALVRNRRPPIWLAGPLILAVVFAIVGAIALDPPKYVIALQAETRLQNEPTIRSSVVRNVRAGAVLTVREERGEWLRVRTIDRREAWVATDDVGMLTTE